MMVVYRLGCLVVGDFLNLDKYRVLIIADLHDILII
tara:strand:- start:534 stop:641 length:108 start_codon:yes stop_codon:yes gene_type:complete